MAIRIRCPVCAREALQGWISDAGSHPLEVVEVKGAGRGKGFLHLKTPIKGRKAILLFLREALLRSLDQVEEEIEACPPPEDLDDLKTQRDRRLKR